MRMQQWSTVHLVVWITVLTGISVVALADDNVSHSTRGEEAFGDRDLDGDVDLFDAAGFQICFSGPGPVEYSIGRPFETPDVDQQELIVTCDDGAFISVRVYAWDQAVNPKTGLRNHDHCESQVIIDDDFGLCTP